jgi:hypothetical protein
MKLTSRPAGFHYNREVPQEERKLSFSYCAFPINTFHEVVKDGLDFVEAYKVEHGFEPHAHASLAIYFVQQSGKRLAGPYTRAEISDDGAHKFVFDPVSTNPQDPEWHNFLDSFHVWAKNKGGRPSVTQSFRLEKDLKWGSNDVHGKACPRFTNPWLQKFFDAKNER